MANSIKQSVEVNKVTVQPDELTPQQRIEQTQKLVFSLANQIQTRLPDHVPVEDLISYGQIGLAQAARSFDSSKGAQFSTYAYYRIRGAIYDGISKMAWLSRSAAARIHADEIADKMLEEDEGPKSDKPKEKATWLVQTTEKLAVVYSMASMKDEEGQRSIVDTKAETPDQIATSMEVISVLRLVINDLTEPHKKFINGLYFEGKSITQVAASFGKSKSWASRQHKKILDYLAAKMKMRGIVN